MPTGYTAPLHNGEPITFEEFALRCSRAMGAAIMQRDESLETEIRQREVEERYAANVDRAKLALDSALTRSTAEWERQQDEEIRKATAARDQYIANKKAIRLRYESMLAEVRNWEPPTSDHDGLKKFMIDQIEESIRFDCGEWNPSIPAPLPVFEYADIAIGKLAQRLLDEQKREREERERVAGQNAWVIALRQSLVKP